MAVEENYLDLPLEEVMGDRFGRYSKYIIQDRALPDARDGLKPVQRRILYAMHEERNTHDKPFRKSAKTVGTVIGNYHPHGDSSVYEAMVRLSQRWKLRNVLVEMHGNNGSVDGDPPAAMRYTEARLSALADEMIRDIEKETVDYIPNFDDTIEEPVVLPAKIPNLLVNGSTGISAGYATEIPPHNLAEVIDAIIKKIDKPTTTMDELLTIIKGPDFPTGGTLQGYEGLKKAYETGKGRVVVRGKATIEPLKANREQILIDEIPYEVNKATLVKRIDELRMDRKVEGIAEVRDETDRTGLRIVVELKKDADSLGVLHYLYKNTDLQITYHFNMVAIKDKTPQLLSLTDMIEAYIAHQKDVVVRQTHYDLQKANRRAHVVEGLIKAVSVLDELIQTIRASEDKKDAKNRIIAQFGFTEEQAEAIVTLQLYRLTNTDITALEKEAEELEQAIARYQEILSNENKLLSVIKKDLRSMKKKYATDRWTRIEEKVEELQINVEVTVASEDVIVSVTDNGYVKRTSTRSYGASKDEDLTMKEDDYLLRLMEVNTTDYLLIFTSNGRFVPFPVHQLPDIKWKELGQHFSNLVSLEDDETIVEVIPIREFHQDHYLVFFTQNGMVKKSKLDLYQSQRYTRPLIALNLKEDDQLVNVHVTDGHTDVFVVSNKGYGLWFHESEVSPIGQRATGVKAMQLKQDEHIINGVVFDEQANPSQLFVATQRGACKRMTLNRFEKSSRAKKGQALLRELKKHPHYIVGFDQMNDHDRFILKTNEGTEREISPMDLPNSDRHSNGSFVIDTDIDGYITSIWKKAALNKPFTEDHSNVEE
ncbi:DNA topoisomerase IV subunit A [Gracilibacillus halophilus YIM-C55.5]|uniref:DNA topoisomerase 4 subunit A n=1 Tax=Gracilibacillus halophilus YIM-C55.5 TaxID=1308866 RepID=N4W9L8_9BACI|nr:DNA topoisomerase IV subunit A [Gracilibacillus halophilus]ENH96978.1 DNA topoisomerase IV subunit A [Gracilibacillus halophilus YIM-C55.5]